MSTPAFPVKNKSKFTVTEHSPPNKSKQLLKKFTHLYLNDKSLYSIKPLQSCEHITVLYLFNNAIAKIENLNNLKNLTYLYLQRNKIQKIENLHALEKLRKLYLGYNQISVVEGLEGLHMLEELHVENQKLRSGDSLCFDPRSIISVAESLTVLNVSGNNITSLSYLAPLRFVRVLNATNNKLNNISDVCDTLKGWYYLHEAMFAGNPMCKQHRWKEKIIATTNKLAILDKKDVNDTTRTFIQRMEHEKNMQRNFNLINQPPGLSKSYSSSIQRAVSRSIIKEIKEQQISFESDISNTCDFIAWNALPAKKTMPFKSLPHIKQKRRPCVPKKVSVTFLDD